MRGRLTKSKMPARTGRIRKRGQAAVEFAVLGFFLLMLLAAAVDFGRAFYTSVVVTNMAGEGAAYAALFPDQDANFPNAYDPNAANRCSQFVVPANSNIQDRARKVAQERGLVIREPSQADIVITPAICLNRCYGNTVTVTVTYRINDLFLPGILGMQNLTITKSATRLLEATSYAASKTTNCSSSD